MTSDIPAGFEVWNPTSLFMQHLIQVGQIYRNESGSAFGLRIDKGHGNVHSVAHGGLLATLVDSVFGNYLAQECQTAVVTVNLSLDYMNATKMGDWIEAHVKIDKRGRRLIYASCTVHNQEKTLVKASGVFAVQG
ncbi:PaaI family thioesterase [Achromobacter sp. F4_2707]|uniref:PaaI family thioesterase n=1 Tax=Achromobacter sp. F4_2707 TaxID=3114286 RepID=UPI0039C686E7